MSAEPITSPALPEPLLRAVLEPLYAHERIVGVAASRIRSFQHELFQIQVRLDQPRRDGDTEELFLRFYAGNFSWWTLESDLAAKEAVAFPYLESLGLRGPPFLLRSENPPLTITRRAPGIPVAEKLNPDSLGQLARTLAALHERSAAALPAGLPDLSLRTFLPRLRSWAEEAKDARLEGMVDQVARNLGQVEEEPSFLHGDCNAKNFLHGAEGTTILDLEESAVGDYRIDCATMITNLPRLESFDTHGHFRAEYERARGRSLAGLEAWINLIDLRDVITARVVEERRRAGKPVPRFRADLWSRYAAELYPRLARRLMVGGSVTARG